MDTNHQNLGNEVKNRIKPTGAGTSIRGSGAFEFNYEVGPGFNYRGGKL